MVEIETFKYDEIEKKKKKYNRIKSLGWKLEVKMKILLSISPDCLLFCRLINTKYMLFKKKKKRFKLQNTPKLVCGLKTGPIMKIANPKIK